MRCVRQRRHWTPRLDRFGALLAFLLIAFLFLGTTDRLWATLVGVLANLAALVVGFSSTGLREHHRRTAVFATMGVVGLILIAAFDVTTVAAGVGASLQAMVLGAVLAALVRRVLQHREVALATILGVISAYVLIGLIFAWILLALVGFRGGEILDPPVTAVPVYYSFVVLSTLGFGDITPVDELARRISAIEAMTGQIFLATVVARFVALYGQRRPGGPGLSEEQEAA